MPKNAQTTAQLHSCLYVGTLIFNHLIYVIPLNSVFYDFFFEKTVVGVIAILLVICLFFFLSGSF